MDKRTFPQRLSDRIASDPDLTEAGLAKAAGLDASTIRQMIVKNRSPRMVTAEKICKALGTTVEEFMSDPASQAAKDIARLMSQLSLDQRRQVLGYAEGLAASGDRSQQPTGEDPE